MPFFAGGYEDSLFAQQVLLTVEQVSTEKETPFFSTSKPSVCQDRLGTNVQSCVCAAQREAESISFCHTCCHQDIT